MTPLLLAANAQRKKGDEVQLRAEAPLGGRNVVGAHVGLQPTMVTGATSHAAAVGLSLARDLASWLQLRARLDLSSYDAEHFGYRSSLMRTAPAFDLLYPLVGADRFTLLAGPTVGVPVLRQKDLRGETTRSWGLSWGGVATAGVRAVGGLWLTGTGTAGGELFRLNGAQEHRTAVSVAFGAAYAF
jgi:hypothetical protein